jgi:hypothetical protein
VRTYTPEVAAAELPTLREQLARIRAARRALIAASERITDADAADCGGVAGNYWYDERLRLREDVTDLAERGILLRDAEGGLVDVPAEREGRIVFLCWRVDEGHLGFWHEQDSGFIGRRPL